MDITGNFIYFLGCDVVTVCGQCDYRAFQELTYPGCSTAWASGSMPQGVLLPVITATSSVTSLIRLLPAVKSFGWEPWVKPLGCSVSMPGWILSRLKKLPR